jgi:tRNA pseudouridine65 synthase
MNLAILYQDAELVVVNKPSGLLVHRGWARDPVVAMTLVRDALGQHVYPVHRLDRGTSGALILALSSSSAARLQALFASGQVLKRYLALVRGIPPESGLIDHPVPHAEDGPRVPAQTEYRRLATFERYALLEAIPKTGRLHQIRRHFKHISHPIVGDVNYGKGEINREFRARFGLHRIALHALEIALPHPLGGHALQIRAPLPQDLWEPLEKMGLACL